MLVEKLSYFRQKKSLFLNKISPHPLSSKTFRGTIADVNGELQGDLAEVEMGDGELEGLPCNGFEDVMNSGRMQILEMKRYSN